MYNAKYVSNLGREVNLGFKFGCVFDIRGIGGTPTAFGRAQNYAEIGESVTTQSIAGTTLTISGVIFGDNAAAKKDEIRRAFAPLSSGTLYFNEKYFINVLVKHTPTISPVKTDGKFTVQLFAPYPFFRSTTKKTATSAQITENLYGTEVVNLGDVPAIPKIIINVPSNGSKYDSISNIKILAGGGLALILDPDFLFLYSGESFEIYRDADGVLKANINRADGSVVDAINYVNASSTLFSVPVKKRVNDFWEIKFIYEKNPGEAQSRPSLVPTFTVEFNEAYTSVYEDEHAEEEDEA